ncbi:hypothetical protein SAMN04488103_102435 [Gemmobacter aquatilis]|uniref:Uncharacterized protein n=1 Tax=Gemmobacter aquatilis TaxID=933059 RepID=A0A1H8C9A6_9RHOB|nr:hypothetical protein [Gemmobacter aquatilis]SEM91635.1 hypothetical protein SAMN04488103_102435 [Gemmobacter aquatilis]
MTELDISHIENTVVADCAHLLNDLTHDRHRITWRISGADVAAIEAEIGVRLTRLVLRHDNFRPAHDESDDWESRCKYRTTVQNVCLRHPEDFRIALAELDVRGRLATALGLA